MKHATTISATLGIIGAALANLFGGWDNALKLLVILMAVDFFSGLAVAGIFKNSKKTDLGGLESKAAWKGLCRKGSELTFVLIGYQIDIFMGIDFVRTAIIIGFSVNELLSIIENMGLMGIQLPQGVYDAVELLKKKGGEHNED